MSHSYILSACRTPIGRYLGALAGIPATQLGGIVVREAVRRASVSPEDVDEVILGNVLSAGLGQAPARQAALGAGLPPTVAALTINKVCGSGLKAVMLADQAIRCGDARCVVAGGMESMSRVPYYLSGVRSGWKFGNQSAVDGMIHDGLWCACENASMGAQADYIAASRQVSRSDQDAYAVESHRRALAAVESGKFVAEIVPVPAGTSKAPQVIDRDEGPRSDSSLAALAKLRVSFEPQPGFEPTVTAGNASQLSDGAAALVVGNEQHAQQSGSPFVARIIASATSGVAPKEIFIAPVTAIQQALAKAKLTMRDIDLIELNEAFAAQALACARPLEIDPERLNVHGGAIALGHPIGASGARVLVSLLHALADRGLNRGLASLCLGGGNAVAMIVERVR